MHLRADLQRPGTEDGKALYLHGDLMIQSQDFLLSLVT